MKINVKNNSKGNSQKIELTKDFLRFCQIHSPLKLSINLTFVDRSTENFFNGTYLVPVKQKKLSECLDLVSQFWIGEFSTQRNIPCGFMESKLLVKFFLEKNPSVQKLLNI
jgi:hypothetical protein